MDILLPGYRIAVTGHRDIRGDRADLVRGVLLQVLAGLQKRHPEGLVAISGMAVGADIEFADAVLQLGIPLVAALPCPGQDSVWPGWVQDRYRKVLVRASQTIEVWKLDGYKAEGIGPQMFARDRWMVDQAEVCIAVWDGRTSGGTFLTLRAARKKRLRVLILNPNTGGLTVDRGPVSSDERLADHVERKREVREVLSRRDGLLENENTILHLFAEK